MPAIFDTNATAAGIDASRRVAWARYYQQIEDNTALTRHNDHLLRHLARLALAIEGSEAVRLLDPRLRDDAHRVLGALRARAKGRAVLDHLEREQCRR